MLEVAVGRAASARGVCRRLRRGRPLVYVGHGLLDEGKRTVSPLHLDDERTAALARRLREEMTSR